MKEKYFNSRVIRTTVACFISSLIYLGINVSYDEEYNPEFRLYSIPFELIDLYDANYWLVSFIWGTLFTLVLVLPNLDLLKSGQQKKILLYKLIYLSLLSSLITGIIGYIIPITIFLFPSLLFLPSLLAMLIGYLVNGFFDRQTNNGYAGVCSLIALIAWFLIVILVNEDLISSLSIALLMILWQTIVGYAIGFSLTLQPLVTPKNH